MAKGNTEIAKATTKTSLLKYFEGMSNAPVTKSNCKLCQSKNREAAEGEFDRTRNYSAVCNFLRNRGEDISRIAVSNHINQHYLPHIKREILANYAANLPSFLEDTRNREDQIRERIWMMENVMYDIASETGDQSLDEKRKSADAMTKISNTISALDKEIEEIRFKMNPVNAVMEVIADIFTSKMKASTESEKVLLQDILDEFTERTDELFVEDRD